MSASPPEHEQEREPKQEDAAGALRVRLYVAGDSPNSIKAIANLEDALATLPRAPGDVEIIDVMRTPERALADSVLVTPMLVRVAPPPERRILGNLSDRGLLLGVLGAPSPAEAPRE